MLGIVILNYNTWDESINCCESIIKNTKVPYRIYLVDNCSPVKANEIQIQILNELKVKIIYNDNNSGYAAGNNVGLKKAYEDDCDCFLICNSDVIIENNSIDNMVAFSRVNSNVGIIGPIIYDKNGKRQQINMLSKLTASGKIKNMLLKTPLKPFFRSFEKSFIEYDKPNKPIKVFGVSGCCFFISKDCYERVFPFDEHTFLYEEEYILGCKLEKAGIDAYVIPGTRIVHAEGSSTKGISDFAYNCFINSEQYYLREYLHSGFIPRFFILILRRLIRVLKNTSTE